MALFKWLSTIAPNSDLDTFHPLIEALGFEVEQSISTQYQLYASDPPRATVEQSSRVSILISRYNQDSVDVTIEVRSSEPMLRKDTRCEQKAKALQAALEQNQ